MSQAAAPQLEAEAPVLELDEEQAADTAAPAEPVVRAAPIKAPEMWDVINMTMLSREGSLNAFHPPGTERHKVLSREVAVLRHIRGYIEFLADNEEDVHIFVLMKQDERAAEVAKAKERRRQFAIKNNQSKAKRSAAR